MATVVAAAALLLGVPARSDAGQVTAVAITFAGGRVSVAADRVPVSAVLAEWTRIGKTEIVGVGLVDTRLVTVKLADVPEDEALEAILGPSYGFVQMIRSVEPGLSVIRRLVIGAAAPPKERPVDPSAPPEARYAYHVPDKVQTGPDYGMPVYEKLDERWVVPEKRFVYLAKEFVTFDRNTSNR